MAGFRAFVVTCVLCVGGASAFSYFNRAPASDVSPPTFDPATHRWSDDPLGPTPARTPAPASTSTARVYVKVGDRVVAYFGDYGCPSADHRKALQRLDAEGDHIAEMLAAKKYDCALIAPHDLGVVEDSSVWTGLSCVRRQGEPECLWYPTPTFVTEAEAAADNARAAAVQVVLDKMDADYDATPKGALELKTLAAFFKSRKPGQLGFGMTATRESGTCEIEASREAATDLKAGNGSQVSWIFGRVTPAEADIEDAHYDDDIAVWVCTPLPDRR